MLYRREPRSFSARLARLAGRLGLVAALALAITQAARAEEVPATASPAPQGQPVALAPAGTDKEHVPLAELQPPITPPASAGEISPLPEKAQRGLARAAELRAEKRFTEAIIELEKAQRAASLAEPDATRDGRGDHPLIRRAMALTRWEAGEFDKARAEIDRVRAVRPDDMVCHYLAGRLAARRFENASAIQALRAALACPATEAEAAFRKLAWFHLAELLSTEGYFTAARQAYEEYLAAAEPPAGGPTSAEKAELQRLGAEAAYAGLARASAALGEYAVAAEQFRKAYASRTTMDPDARLELARLLAKAGDVEAAIAEARAVVVEKPEAYALLEELYATQNAPSGALEELEAAVKAHPESAPLAKAYFDALRRAGRDDEAAAFMEQRLAADPQQGELAEALFQFHRERGDWVRAFAALASALRNRPDLAPDLAQRVGEMAEQPQAVQSIVAEVEPADADDFADAYLRGVLARRSGHAEKAEAWLKAAVSARPDFVAARVALGEAYLDRYAWNEAIAVAAPEGQKISDSRLELILGKAYAGLDEPAQAQLHFNSAIRLNRANTEAMLALAELLIDAQEPGRARQQLETLVAAEPTNERARELLFGQYLRMGDARAAAEQLEELRRTGASPNTIARCVAWMQFDASSPDYGRVQETLQQAMEAYKPDAPTLHLLALFQQLDEHPEKAVASLEQALALDPRHEDSAALLALVYQRNLDFEAALRQRELLLQRRPNRREWKLDRLNLLHILQRWDDAVAYGRQLLEDPKLDVETKALLRRELVRTLQLAEDLPASIEMLEALHAEQPDDVDILNWLLTSLQEAGRHDEVLGYLRRWTELVSSGFAEGPAERVWRKLPPEHAPEVEQLVVGWLMQEPDQDARQLAMIAFLRGTGQHEAALSLARANEAVSESRGMYFQWEAYQALKAARRTDEAMAALTRLTGELGAGDMGASVASVQFQYELISLMLEAGRFDKARERINHWLQSARTEPERLMYLQMLTLCEQEAGRLEEAIQALELALELAPDEVGSHNDLGYTLADLGREIERAGQLVRYAVSHEPRNSAFLDSLGWVKYKEEDYAAAVKWLRLSRYAGEGEDPTVCDHLGDAYWRLGNKEEARRFWNEAIQFARKRLEEAPQRLLYQQTLEAAQAKLAALERGETPQVAEPARKQ